MRAIDASERRPLVRYARRALLGTVLLLGGCSVESIPGIYRLDIQQGNIVTAEMLAKLEKGMEKRKVRFILGTPAIMDAFDQDRWNYIYSFQPGGGRRSQRAISLLFEQGRLVRVAGDVKPGSGQRRIEERRDELVVDVPADHRDRGILSSIFRRSGQEKPAKRGSTLPAEETTEDTASSGPKSPKPGPEAKSEEQTASGPEVDDGGFFKRLLNRFRPSDESQKPRPPGSADEPTPAPAPGPAE